MKKIGFVLILLVLNTFVFAQAPSAVLREITGTVELKRSVSSEWVSASPGDRLDSDTIISTGFRSSAVIETGTSVITVQPVTRLSLAAVMNMNDETVNININTGRIRADVKPPSGSRAEFTVNSPSAVASVRGTSFEQDVVSISVSEGVVRYETTANTPAIAVLVTANQSSWIDTDTGTPVSAVDAAIFNRRLPGLAGEEALPGGGAGILNPFGGIDVGVNLANSQGFINIGTNLANSHGSVTIEINLR